MSEELQVKLLMTAIGLLFSIGILFAKRLIKALDTLTEVVTNVRLEGAGYDASIKAAHHRLDEHSVSIKDIQSNQLTCPGRK